VSTELADRKVTCHHCGKEAKTSSWGAYGVIMEETGYMPVLCYDVHTMWFCPSCTQALEPHLEQLWNALKPLGTPDLADSDEGRLHGILRYGNFNLSMLAASLLKMREYRAKA
jgi:hypothetical protein